MAPVTPPGPDLAVPRRAAGRRGPRLAAYAGAVVVLVAVAAWVATHPAALPTSQRTVTGSAPVGQAVYVGVFDVPSDFGRTLHLSGVRVFADATTEATIVPMLCRGGSVGVTTTPESFCTEVLPTEGATLGAGDAILLEVPPRPPGRSTSTGSGWPTATACSGRCRTPAHRPASRRWGASPRAASPARPHARWRR